jgi:sec-independent protein translocase protein TatA
MSTLALLPNLSPLEIIVILVIALLLFGKRLPEVGRSLGKGIVEFKKGIQGVEDDVKSEDYRPRRDERAQFSEGRERQATDERRVGRADNVETPQGGSNQPRA